MHYKFKEAMDLMSKGVINLTREEASQILAALFEKPKASIAEESKIENAPLLNLIEETTERITQKTKEVEKVKPALVDFSLLRELDGSYGPHNATRIITSIRKFNFKKYNDRFDLTPFDQFPTDNHAVDLYNAAIDLANSGQIDQPWEYQRCLGEGSFRLLEAYLTKKGLIKLV